MRGTLVDRCDRCGAFLRAMTPEQHAAVEMVYIDLSNQLDWPVGSGQMHDQPTWHQLMVDAYVKAEWGRHARVLPALDGEGVTVVTRQKQSRLSKKQASELIEFAKAWAIEHGVKLTEPERQAA